MTLTRTLSFKFLSQSGHKSVVFSRSSSQTFIVIADMSTEICVFAKVVLKSDFHKLDTTSSSRFSIGWRVYYYQLISYAVVFHEVNEPAALHDAPHML